MNIRQALLCGLLPADELLRKADWVVGCGQASEAGALLADAAASIQGPQGVRPYGGDGIDAGAVAQGDQVAGREDAEFVGRREQLLDADVAGGPSAARTAEVRRRARDVGRIDDPLGAAYAGWHHSPMIHARCSANASSSAASGVRV